MSKARAAKAAKQNQMDTVLAELAELRAKVNAQAERTDESVTPGPEAGPGLEPGSYIRDNISGRDVKVRWSRAAIEKRYPAVTFTPLRSMPVRPHGITRGEWQLKAGEEITCPSIVKDIYTNSVRADLMQTEAWKGFNPDQERAAFEATRKQNVPHASPLQHVGYGWNPAALAASREMALNPKAQIDPSSVGHEPEQGFPGGFKGAALDEAKI